MKVLMLYSDYSIGVKQYVYDIRDNIDINMTFAKLPKIGMMCQQSARDTINREISLYRADVVHLQYDNNMFVTDGCEYEEIENFAWFLRILIGKFSRVYVTFHGVTKYQSTNLITRWMAKTLFELYTKQVLPVLKQCSVVVHSQSHYKHFQNLGIDRIYIQPPGINRIENSGVHEDTKQHKIVIPGVYREYKQYSDVFDALTKLSEQYVVDMPIPPSEHQEHIYNMVVDRGIFNQVNFFKPIPHKNAYLKQLSEYDIAVLPYNQSIPSSGSLNDCLAAGLDVVTTATDEFQRFKLLNRCIHTYINANGLAVTLDQITKNDDFNLDYYQDQYIINNSWDKVSLRYRDMYSPIEQSSDEYINIFMCCRDNDMSLSHALMRLKVIESKMSKPFRYYLYENDSQDQTPWVISTWLETNPGAHLCETRHDTKWLSEPGSDRVYHMAMYRNKCKSLCRDWSDTKYSVILDCDIQFDIDAIENQINYMEQNEQVAAMTSYGVVKNTNQYYDMFAYEHIDNSKQLPDVDHEPFRVNSAFGGVMCLRSHVLKRCDWIGTDGDCSEHVPFCQQVRNYGDVMVNPNVIVTW